MGGDSILLNCRGGGKRTGWDQIEGRFGSGGSGGGGGGGGGGGMKKYAIIFTCGGIWEKVVPPPSFLFFIRLRRRKEEGTFVSIFNASVSVYNFQTFWSGNFTHQAALWTPRVEIHSLFSNSPHYPLVCAILLGGSWPDVPAKNPIPRPKTTASHIYVARACSKNGDFMHSLCT